MPLVAPTDQLKLDRDELSVEARCGNNHYLTYSLPKVYMIKQFMRCSILQHEIFAPDLFRHSHISFTHYNLINTRRNIFLASTDSFYSYHWLSAYDSKHPHHKDGSHFTIEDA